MRSAMIFHSHADWVSDYFEYKSWTKQFEGFAKMYIFTFYIKSLS